MSERPAGQDADPLAGAVERANEALDWIEARQGPLPATNYARIETDVRTVRAMAEGQDERISEWSESDELLRWTLEQHTRSLNNAGEQRCAQCYTRIPCDIAALAASGLDRSARLDALAAERNTIQSAWTRDKALLDEAIDHHMSRWKKDEAERDALAARLAATEAANARAADRIMQDVLDLDPDDPEHPDTICISYDALVVVLENALRGADAALAGSRERAATEES